MKKDSRNRNQDNSGRYYDSDRYSRWNNYAEYNDYNDYENRRSLPNNFQRGNYDDRFNDVHDDGGYKSNYENDFRKENYRSRYPANRNYRENENDYKGHERTWWNKTTDEVASWLGDDDAQRRREIDDIRDYNHRGKGPKNYKRSPERIKDDVNDKLSDHWMIDATEIEVEVKDSEVTLNGTVDSRQSKIRAEDVAESVSGVTYVQNNLRINKLSDTYKKAIGNESPVSNPAYTNGIRKKESMNHN